MARARFIPIVGLVCLGTGCGGDVTLLVVGDCPGGLTSAGDCLGDEGCETDEECEENYICNAAGVCEPAFVDGGPCEGDEDCEKGEICSAVIDRCLPEGECREDADCRVAGEHCTGNGVCLPVGTCINDGDCDEGYVCEGEACVPGGECGEQEFTLEVAPNLLILLDRSGSMDELIDGVSKWDIAVDALTTNIGAYDGAIRFGLAMFSNCDIAGDCDAGAVEIPCADDTIDDITTTLGAAPRCSSTPIGASLDAMIGETSIQDDTRKNAILLLTDGEDTCPGPEPEVAAGDLLAQTIPVETYVVGFGSGVDATQLAETADAGGTALCADPVYYQADSAGALATALDDISARVLGCVFDLPQPPPGDPPDASLVHVFVNGTEEVAQDSVDGWTYDQATNTVTFHGEACVRMQAGEITDLDVYYECPSDVG